jgi:hypothetical protein
MLITKEKVIEYLQLEAPEESKITLITDLIKRATKVIQTYCRRDFLVKSYTEELDGEGLANLYLRQSPILSVESVNINDQLDTSFKIRHSMGVLTRTQGFWPKGILNIQVSYRAGFETIPEDIEQACILFVAFYYKTDIADFTNVFTEGGGFVRPEAFPGRVRALLDPYRRVVL